MSFFKNLFSRSKKQIPVKNEPENKTPDVAAAPMLPSEQEHDLPAEQGTPSSQDSASRQEPTVPTRIHPVAWQIADCIETEFASTELSVRGFAEALNMNPTYLCRIFRSSYQISISDYLNRTRIRHSLPYLEETDMPIEEIARTVGFENTKYFFVLFKNIMGMTPRQYRISRCP